MTNTDPLNSPADPFSAAVERLRQLLPLLETDRDAQEIETCGKETVYDRYGQPNGVFAPAKLEALAADDFLSFLHYKNNCHWSHIHRYGTRMVKDMDRLRETLRLLLDTSRPLPERYSAATGEMVKGLGRSVATPILHVVYPEHYGVWNEKSEAGLQMLGLYPDFAPGTTAGMQYATVNAVLLRLASELSVSLWTLDTLWHLLSKERKLAPPFNAIFADREQTEWAFDFFAATVEALGGRENERLMALTIVNPRTTMRLNYGSWSIVAASGTSTKKSYTMMLTIPKSKAEALGVNVGEEFASGPSGFSVGQFPLDDLRKMPEDELKEIFWNSLPKIYESFKHHTSSTWHGNHEPEVFAALFDLEKRARLLDGIAPPPPLPPRYWRIILPTAMEVETEAGNMSVKVWEVCLRHNLAAIDFKNDPTDKSVKKFAEIRPGDQVVAFLLNKRIGGIGVVTKEMDPSLAQRQPGDQDLFHGRFWFRIGVEWTPVEASVDDLPDKVANKFGMGTVLELTQEEFEAIKNTATGVYTAADFQKKTHLSPDRATELCEVLREKRQIIFYGPPGTGKTYVARELGKLLTGLAEPPDERLTIVQFHPAYGYEDFIEGIRPESKERDGRFHIDYPVREGIFRRFCIEAARLGKDTPCVLVIDEINRGNLSRIFGELMYLLEYRDQPVRLPYSGQTFRIPENVYLIGTMNTADRSIALVDFALRRRFQFFHFKADPVLYDNWLAAHPPALPYLSDLYRALATEAIEDVDFKIGPSYFMDPALDEKKLERIWKLSILPLLQEYHLDQLEKVAPWEWDGVRVRGIRKAVGGGGTLPEPVPDTTVVGIDSAETAGADGDSEDTGGNADH